MKWRRERYGEDGETQQHNECWLSKRLRSTDMCCAEPDACNTNDHGRLRLRQNNNI